jgi:hypothetical protein
MEKSHFCWTTFRGAGQAQWLWFVLHTKLLAFRTRAPERQVTILTISGSVRNTATLLEVLVAMKMPLLSGLDPANA